MQRQEENKKTSFNLEIQQLMDSYVNLVYDCSMSFPREEIFGLTSQLRRASMSVVLNYIEGYARRRQKVFVNFLETSYGSLKESVYIIQFSFGRKLITKENYEKLINISDRIGKMLWGIISKLE